MKQYVELVVVERLGEHGEKRANGRLCLEACVRNAVIRTTGTSGRAA